MAVLVISHHRNCAMLLAISITHFYTSLSLFQIDWPGFNTYCSWGLITDVIILSERHSVPSFYRIISHLLLWVFLITDHWSSFHSVHCGKSRTHLTCSNSCLGSAVSSYRQYSISSLIMLLIWISGISCCFIYLRIYLILKYTILFCSVSEACSTPSI